MEGEVISCRKFIKEYGKSIEAYCNSLSALLLGESLEGLMAFMQYQGVDIRYENGVIVRY